MCFDDGAIPPIAPMAGAAVDAARIHLSAADGNRLVAFEARAGGAPTEAAMLVLPDVRGLHRFYEELALRFAEAGIDALAVDYYGRTAPNDTRGPEFEHMPHAGRTTWAGLRADIAAAADHLRTAGPRRLFSVGFCFGGRIALLTATVPQLALAGAIGFYGMPTGRSRNDTPAPAEVADQNRAPVLALFGGADDSITSSDVAAYRAALEAAGAAHEIVSYPGATHSFFDRRQTEFAAASADAWQRILAFVRSPGGVP